MKKIITTIALAALLVSTGCSRKGEQDSPTPQDSTKQIATSSWCSALSAKMGNKSNYTMWSDRLLASLAVRLPHATQSELENAAVLLMRQALTAMESKEINTQEHYDSAYALQCE